MARFCLGLFCIMLAMLVACGRVGSLTAPPDYAPPPPEHGEVQSTTKDRRDSLLKNIEAPKKKPQKKPPQQKQ